MVEDIKISWETTAINTLPDATTVMTSVDTYTSTLMINSVDLMSIGDYSCVAMNDGGMSISTATLSVIGKRTPFICLFICLLIYVIIYIFLFSSSSSGNHFSWVC